MEVECEDVYSVSPRQSLYIDIIDAAPSVFNFDIDVKRYGTIFKPNDFCRHGSIEHNVLIDTQV